MEVETQSNTKKLLQIVLAWVQHQTDIGKSILHDTTTPLPHLEARWLPSLQMYSGASGLKLDLGYTGVYSL
eukprot:15340450-Ditylum_brightwellii.AAC.1